MTWGNTLIVMITLANFALLLTLTRHIIRINRFRDMIMEERNAFELEPAPSAAEPMIAAPEPLEPVPCYVDRRETPTSKKSQIQTAIARLKSGESPEQVARDLGYSRSEIGMLAASAGRS